MKNIQVIDGADNCTYDIFQISDKDFKFIFPGDTDIEFIEDFCDRVGEDKATEILAKVWKKRVDKKAVNGIHGTLFYELDYKKKYYPTKKDSEMLANPID